MAPPPSTIAMGVLACATLGMAIRHEVVVRRAADERTFPPQEALPPPPDVPAALPTIDERVATAMTALRAELDDDVPRLRAMDDDDRGEQRLDELAEATEATSEWMPDTGNSGLTLSFTKTEISARVCAELGRLVRTKWGEPTVHEVRGDELQTWTSADARTTATFLPGASSCQLRFMTHWVPIEEWLGKTDTVVPTEYIGKPAATLREMLVNGEAELLIEDDHHVRWRVQPTSTMYYVPAISAFIENDKIARIVVSMSAPPETADEIKDRAKTLRIRATVEQSNYDELAYDLTIGVPALQGKTP